MTLSWFSLTSSSFQCYWTRMAAQMTECYQFRCNFAVPQKRKKKKKTKDFSSTSYLNILKWLLNLSFANQNGNEKKSHRWNTPQSWRNELPFTFDYNSLSYMRTVKNKIDRTRAEPRFSGSFLLALVLLLLLYCFEVVIKMSSNDNLQWKLYYFEQKILSFDDFFMTTWG